MGPKGLNGFLLLV